MKKEKDSSVLLDFIAQTIFDKKGVNILALDVRGYSSISDFLIIAEGNVDRHVQALANSVIEAMKKEKHILPYIVEGKESGNWIVIDYVDIAVHLFMPGLREKYQLEKLWPKAKIVNVHIEIKKESIEKKPILKTRIKKKTTEKKSIAKKSTSKPKIEKKSIQKKTKSPIKRKKVQDE
jgi:ribosome-associated protein